MSDEHCCKLTIFEGPDGSGKTTMAKRYAETTGARYVHFGPLPRVGDGLARIYVEAMLPALLGYQDVVFDRSWLSEVPYGVAFREGVDRLGDPSRRMLERLAFRCGAVVVACDPGWDLIKKNFLDRKHLEMLDNDQQLFEVYDLYRSRPGDLPTVLYDYVNGGDKVGKLALEVSTARPPRHKVKMATAGRWGAPIIIVGESFGEIKNQDPLIQWPFASFSRTGCSQWLATQLDAVRVGENKLMWVNADQDLGFLTQFDQSAIIALGTSAFAALTRLPWPVGRVIHKVPHPQFHKRFGAGAARYTLLDVLKELIK